MIEEAVVAVDDAAADDAKGFDRILNLMTLQESKNFKHIQILDF